MELLFSAIPILSFLASLTLLALGAFQLISSSFVFWPPPEDQPWKKWVFMALFRIVVYGLVIASAVHIWKSELRLSSLVSLLSISLLLIGFAIAFAATGTLGWRNAFGSKDGLRTDGIFGYSRNPIYIATWFGLAGWALLVPEPFIVATLLSWAMLYVIAIYIEEKWLAQEYGEAFNEYCQQVRRFF